MARRSLLTPALHQEPIASPHAVQAAPILEAAQSKTSSSKPSRMAKLHIGGYFDPLDPLIIAFQKLKIDLRRSQQEMLLDAIRDYVAKHEAGRAFR